MDLVHGKAAAFSYIYLHNREAYAMGLTSISCIIWVTWHPKSIGRACLPLLQSACPHKLRRT